MQTFKIMADKATWDCKTSKFFYNPEFNIYISSSCDENYNPQEIMKDIKEFEQFMIDKYVKKTETKSWFQKILTKIK